MPRSMRLSHAELTQLSAVPARRMHGRYLSLAIFPLPARKRVGCACVISKRTAQSAVVRNALRRRCKAALLPLISKDARPLGFVLTLKAAALQASVMDLRDDIGRLLEKLA